MSNVKIIIGPPGTGKTKRCIDIMEREMENGVEPEEIAFVSFTKKATQEAMQRVTQEFRLAQKDFPWVRTLHSMAFAAKGIKHDNVMSTQHYREIGRMLGITFNNVSIDDILEGNTSAKTSGDYFNYLHGFSRARKVSPETAWAMLECDQDVDWWEFKRYVKTVEEYKNDNGLIDFSDMLEVGNEYIPVKVAIIDEAQDLSTAQWTLAASLFRNAERIYIAGDDDQAIYTWSGADVKYFLQMDGEREVLSQSHRIPRAVHKIAGEIADRITTRLPKQYKPRDEEGSVEFHSRIGEIDLSSGTWLLLARNSYMLGDLSKLCRDQGVAYSFKGGSSINKNHLKAISIWEGARKGITVNTAEALFVESFMPLQYKDNWPKHLVWHEALTIIPFLEREYYISLLRRGEPITKEPRIHISTIHGIKGGEADNVALVTDISQRTFYSQEKNPDAEHRVWYVAATRAKQALHVIQPHTKHGYLI